MPLSNVATVTQTRAAELAHQFPAAQLGDAVSAVPFPGRTVGEAIDFLKQKAANSFPEGFSYDFQGESRQFVQEGNTLVYTFVFALVIIFLVLAAQYESFRDPLIILDRAADLDLRRAASRSTSGSPPSTSTPRSVS